VKPRSRPMPVAPITEMSRKIVSVIRKGLATQG
jgi:hypothetical protein